VRAMCGVDRYVAEGDFWVRIASAGLEKSGMGVQTYQFWGEDVWGGERGEGTVSRGGEGRGLTADERGS